MYIILFFSHLTPCDHTSKSILCTIGAIELRDSDFPASSSRSHHDVPAPPAAMAMVATVLSDFPNPPAAAVVPSDAVLKPPAHTEEGTIAIKELANDPKGTALLSAALETTVNPKNRKRTASTIEIPAGNLDEGHDIDDVFAAASEWANLPSTNCDETTKVKEVDRHCKVRFVERLTSVIAGTERESDSSPLGTPSSSPYLCSLLFDVLTFFIIFSRLDKN